MDPSAYSKMAQTEVELGSLQDDLRELQRKTDNDQIFVKAFYLISIHQVIMMEAGPFLTLRWQ